MDDPTADVNASAAQLARAFDGEKAGSDHWGLAFWPLIWTANWDSESAVAFQVHAAAAYGADGVGYFLWSYQGVSEAGGEEERGQWTAGGERRRRHLRAPFFVCTHARAR